MRKNVEIKVNLDNDGFMSQECPSCLRRFKIQPGDRNDEPVRFCPYCDHTGTACWWTPAQVEYLGAVAAEQTIGVELEKMVQSFNRSSRNHSSLKASMSMSKPTLPKPPTEVDESWPVFEFECCSERIKHDDQNRQLFCIICGVESTLAPSS